MAVNNYKKFVESLDQDNEMKDSSELGGQGMMSATEGMTALRRALERSAYQPQVVWISTEISNNLALFLFSPSRQEEVE